MIRKWSFSDHFGQNDPKMTIFGSKIFFHLDFTSKIILITPTKILVKMNFTEILVVFTEINVLDHLYNQIETVTETVSEFY